MNPSFAIIRPLTPGAYGDVYVARCSLNGEFVVIKYLRDHHSLHARKAFAREFKVLNRKLRGLVPILFADIEGPRPYYVTPYFGGGSLANYAGKLYSHQIIAIATELTQTLFALQKAMITHGDVKPDNILVSSDGGVSLADPLGNGFGCTALLSQNHGGTPGYWAPEVRAGAPISQAADVYSIGATIFHLVTGKRPRDDQQLDFSHDGQPDYIRLREIVLACCLPDAKARPNFQELLKMLKGECWAEILTARKRAEDFAGQLIVGGLAVLLLIAAAKD